MKQINNTLQQLDKCQKKKCSKSKNIKKCMKTYCSKANKEFNNSGNSFIKQKKQKLKKSIKKLKKCSKKYCKKYSLDKIKKKKCIKKKCEKELNEVTFNMM